MKLYVWKGVLCDYTCGIAFAIAESPEEARQAVIDGFESDKGYIADILLTDLKGKYEVYPVDEPVGFAIWGGG